MITVSQTRSNLLSEIPLMCLIRKNRSPEQSWHACKPGGVEASVEVFFGADACKHERISTMFPQKFGVGQFYPIRDDLQATLHRCRTGAALALGDAHEVIVRRQTPDRFRVPGRGKVQRNNGCGLLRDAVPVEVEAVHMD